MSDVPEQSTDLSTHIPLGAMRWWAVSRPVLTRINSNRTGLAAAGCAFYATLALFPAISMLVSLYGLVFDPASVEPQLGLLQGLLPPEAFTLIAQALHALVARPRATLGWNLGISSTVALWSSATGTKSILAALNFAYRETERRGVLRFQATGLAVTLAAILAAMLAVALLVALPVAATFLGLPGWAAGLIHAASLAVMMGFVAAAFAVLYRFGPSRRPGRVRRVVPGMVAATLLWLAASLLFTDYVARIASFDVTYGPLGAVAGMMLWFWVSAYAVLIGAELNSALELRDSAPDQGAGAPAEVSGSGP